MVKFAESVTKDNLMRAFAGESQARNRYTFAASQAKKNGLYVISAIFGYTASQEKEHAEIFYNHLKDLAGSTITVDGGYPVDISDDVWHLLDKAQHNEYEEHDPIYRSFGETAKKEGFDQIASSFLQIAQVEKTGPVKGSWRPLRKICPTAQGGKTLCVGCGRGVDVPELRFCVQGYKGA